jgi:hypothetical protein
MSQALPLDLMVLKLRSKLNNEEVGFFCSVMISDDLSDNATGI